ncbi:MAG: hypothetical protein HY581_02825 [Nitrospirae bacterium]|nr:hypothetical protein [Nitrospirota bacterium]
MMDDRLVFALESCSDPALVGGKAAGLGRLIRNGFRVPPGVCLSTVVYRDTLRAAGVDFAKQWARLRRASELGRGPMLDEGRRLVASLTVPQAILETLDAELTRLETAERGSSQPGDGMLWAVRSSATDEDATGATFGGVYRTTLGVPRRSIATAIVACWASLWTPAAFAYRSRVRSARAAPAMAVILQPLLSPRAAGVAFSRHPVTEEANRVVINAVFGLAEPLVGGYVTPDQYVAEVGREPTAPQLLQRHIAEKTSARVPTQAGLLDQALPEADRKKPVLEDHEVLALAGLVKNVERTVGRPVGVEWAIDRGGTWLLQARPIPDRGELAGHPPFHAIVWSRANFKETLPELPCPLTLSFVHEFMETNIVRHYREAGCYVPPGLSSVRVIRGRPYINVTLFQALTAQLGGDPELVTEQMGGEVPVPVGVTRLAWWRLVRAGLVLEWKILCAAHQAPAWFAELKQLGTALADHALEHLTERAVLDRRRTLNERLRKRDLTFAFVSGVSQALYVLGLTLERRLPGRWRPLFNAATRGLGGIISANQILWLAELAEIARQEPAARDFLLAEPWVSEGYRSRLTGTKFLDSFDAFLTEYGHRAIGESDVMSPRYAETPEYLLNIVRGHLKGPATRSVQDIRREQEVARQTAFLQIRTAFGWRLSEWAWFRWWHRFLCRYLELREANRHYLMYFTMGFRQLLLVLGRKLAARGVLETADDIFFLIPEEIETIVAESAREHGRDWKPLTAARRAERERCAQDTVPETVVWRADAGQSTGPAAESESLRLRGIPISAGYAEGPVRLVLSPEDTKRVQSGDIIVAPVIDPGMAPLLGLAAGLVIEMGGTLSHGAIVAREYGLPAVANVRHATKLLRDGELVAVDASLGEISRLNPP